MNKIQWQVTPDGLVNMTNEEGNQTTITFKEFKEFLKQENVTLTQLCSTKNNTEEINKDYENMLETFIYCYKNDESIAGERIELKAIREEVTPKGKGTFQAVGKYEIVGEKSGRQDYDLTIELECEKP